MNQVLVVLLPLFTYNTLAERKLAKLGPETDTAPSAVSDQIGRAATMEQAWRERCSRLTPAQLSSFKSCEEHSRDFSRQLVRQGLTGTLLSGCDDVQEVIANHLSGSLSAPRDCPSAAALRALAESSKSFKIARMAEELAAKRRTKFWANVERDDDEVRRRPCPRRRRCRGGASSRAPPGAWSCPPC